MEYQIDDIECHIDVVRDRGTVFALNSQLKILKRCFVSINCFEAYTAKLTTLPIISRLEAVLFSLYILKYIL